MKIIDSHIHIFNWNQTVDFDHADYWQFITPFKGIERFNWKKADGIQENYKDCVREYMRCRNMEYVNVACIPYLRDRDISQNLMAALLKLENDRVFAHGGIVYPDQPVKYPFPKGLSPELQLEELMNIGFDGIKMLEHNPKAKKLLKADFRNKEFAPFFKKLEEEQIHILWHVNDPPHFWDVESKIELNGFFHYTEPDYPSNLDVYDEIYEILRRYPNLKVTFAHLFFMSLDRKRLEELLEKYPNVWLDVTPNPLMYCDFALDIDAWKQFFIKYADRIMFGSDFSTRGGGYSIPCIYRFFMTDEEFVFGNASTVHGMNLSEDVAERIFYSNFLKRVGDRPREIDRDALSSYLRKYDSLLTNAVNREPILQDFRNKGLLD